jgi:hypothetical protein
MPHDLFVTHKVEQKNLPAVTGNPHSVFHSLIGNANGSPTGVDGLQRFKVFGFEDVDLVGRIIHEIQRRAIRRDI